MSISKFLVTALVAMILQNNMNNICSIEPLANSYVFANNDISIASVNKTYKFGATKTVYTIGII